MSSRKSRIVFQRSILSLHRCWGHSLSCQSPKNPTWSWVCGQQGGQDCKEPFGMRRGTRAGGTTSISSIWATSKTTLSIPKRIFCATDRSPFSHGLHVWKSMPYCAIQTDFKATKSNILLQFDIKALVIKYITIPLVFSFHLKVNNWVSNQVSYGTQVQQQKKKLFLYFPTFFPTLKQWNKRADFSNKTMRLEEDSVICNKVGQK